MKVTLLVKVNATPKFWKGVGVLSPEDVRDEILSNLESTGAEAEVEIVTTSCEPVLES